MSDVMPVNYTTSVGKVRALIPDVQPIPNLHELDMATGLPVESYILSDDMINAFLTLNNNSIRRAAADACAVIGRNELYVGKVITTQDLATDAAKVAAQFLAHAKDLRDQADAEDIVSGANELDGVQSFALFNYGYPYGCGV